MFGRLILICTAALLVWSASLHAVEREFLGMAKVGDGSNVDQEWTKFIAAYGKRAPVPDNPNADPKDRYRAVCCAVAGDETNFQPDWVIQTKAVNLPANVPLFGSLEVEEEGRDGREQLNFRVLRNGGPTDFIGFRRTGERRRYPTAVEQIQKFTSMLLESEEYPNSALLNQIDALVTTAHDSRELGKLVRRVALEKTPESGKTFLAALNKLLDQNAVLYERYAELLNVKQLRLVGNKKVDKPEMDRPRDNGARGEKYSAVIKKAEKGYRDKLIVNVHGLKLPELCDRLIDTFKTQYGKQLEKPEVPPTLADVEVSDEFEFEKSDDVWAAVGKEVGFKYMRRDGRVQLIPDPNKKR